MIIGIIDYGMGNLQSVKNALDYLHIENFISSDKDELRKADKLILPGVGAFRDAIYRVKEMQFDGLLKDFEKENKPILGICLGMQLFFDASVEFGNHKGLSLMEGDIVYMDVDLKVPHMGWNRLEIKKKAPLFVNLPEESYVYFVHSYHLDTKADVVSATTFYGKDLPIAAQSGCVYALQFHPEKSGDIGVQILRNFANI